ncbi:YndM family protein [Salicibibacter cibarius]|uniref:YndM family protein n=1 Tax=Salicibibacter cibarius TaxID=2743000 RepID=A0A7T6Z5I4_9BACI|nr:YndM family protein [Salicibibacter cibarius]QQK77275.1 YndM family protein [Salicibibacter cibarius]
MRYVGALIIKLLMITLMLWVFLGVFGGISLANILLVSVLLTGVSFLVGDLYVLKNFGNTLATVVDFVFIWVGLWALGAALFPFEGLVLYCITSAFFIAAGEGFFHLYMEKIVLTETESNLGRTSTRDLQTEFGSDVDIKSDVEKTNKKKK